VNWSFLILPPCAAASQPLAPASSFERASGSDRNEALESYLEPK